ncbi:MAG: carboxypeptidase regulatory-like domain-containing protein [Nitrosomonas sp.]|nr:carboxypeptidase regulatory-like domain-containing protein [Nitrosomonas sp.]
MNLTLRKNFDMILSIHGQVINSENGTPVENASVIIIDGNGSFPEIASMTDFEGKFSLENVPLGKYQIRAYGLKGEEGKKTVVVTHKMEAIKIFVE